MPNKAEISVILLLTVVLIIVIYKIGQSQNWVF